MDRKPDSETLAVVGSYLDRLRGRVRPLRAILFGSRARAEHLKESDFDLILISDQFASMGFRERVIAVTDAWDEPVRLDVLCYTPDELERKKCQIGVVAEALRQGVELS